MSLIDNIETSRPSVEIRKVQALVGERSFVTVLPKSLATELGIRKGDYLRCFIDKSRLVMEKV
jgi:bifunctional DNA-binding transcriptional regulator/antitoxin component of YhaV-PrlF toxin-antitoxin module